MIEGLQVMAEMYNQDGGLTIGEKKYPIQLIVYDSGTDETSLAKSTGETAINAVNRLIFFDEVKFILADPSGVDSWLELTEAEQVVLCAASPTTAILSPNNQYSFQAGFMNSQPVALAQWFAQQYPDKKNIVLALPDDPRGHQFADINERALEASGMTVETIFYSSSQTEIITNLNYFDHWCGC